MNITICTDREIKCSECQTVVDCAGGCECLYKSIRPNNCPNCQVPYINGLCCNPKCWVDNNPKVIKQ